MVAPKLHVQSSPVHGRGLFAAEPLDAGQRLIEYTGERISLAEALRRVPDDGQHPHTFQLSRGDGSVIDGSVGGNRSRWVNHGCDANCVALERAGRVFLHALRDIAPGEELLFDYALRTTQRRTATVRRLYACHCGSPYCRGTLLSLRRRPRPRRRAPAP